MAKQKQIEIYELAKRKALSDYIETSLNLANCKTPSNEAQFYIALNKLYLYFPNLSEIGYDKLSDIDNTAESQSDFPRNTIELLAKQIKKQ